VTSESLTFVTGARYDTRFLIDGSVPVRGLDVDVIDAGSAPVPATVGRAVFQTRPEKRYAGAPFAAFHDMITSIPYDIGEQAFSHYLIAKDQGKPLTAVPAFPSRFFPQLGATVRLGGPDPIRTPLDLVGRRVGVPGFGYNPAVWMRGILAHRYGVPVEEIIWVEERSDPLFAGLDYPRPARYTVERADNLLERLLAGDLDAILPPGGGPPVDQRMGKLFADPLAECERYVRDTSVFPINTVITLKQSALERHPDLPARLMEALGTARERYQADVAAGTEDDHMGLATRWLGDLGLFPDRYGLEANRAAVQTMIDYCYEQGVIRTRFEPDELFC
jgi:4,5-dihydroxyphthalate decarboxylase